MRRLVDRRRSAPAALYGAGPLTTPTGESFGGGAAAVRVADVPPDGRSIAYLARVPEAGRHGAHSGAVARPRPKPEEEAPRRIATLAYRLDGKGFLRDKPEQIFPIALFDDSGSRLPDAAPRR